MGKTRSRCSQENWDASLNKQDKIMRIGVIIRNERGEVLAVACDKKSFVTQPNFAECLAL